MTPTPEPRAKTKPRVLFFPPVSYFKGGAERSLFDLMRNPGITPCLVVPEEGPISEAARAEGVAARVLPLGGVSSIRRPITPPAVLGAMGDWNRAAGDLLRICREDAIDILHCNGLKADCVGGLARRRGGPPTLFHVRDIAVRPSERLIWRALARGCDRMVLVSRACWPGDTPPAHVSVVHNGVAPTPWTEPPRRADDTVTLGFCGRVHPFKGLDLLLDWLASARAGGARVRLVVRGEAAPGDEAYLETLRVQVAALDLGEDVRFEGRVEGIAAVYAGLDAVVVPSEIPDPLPRSVMEAMSLGLPVIGYPAGGIPDMIENGRDGWLAANAEDFVRALAMIAAGGPALDAIRRAAWQTINDRFSLEAMYARINAIYAEMLDAA